MASIFRSETMTLAQLFLQSEAAFACVRELGELGKVQFRDLNQDLSAFKRKFVSEVRRCDEMERKLRFLASELEKSDIHVRPAGNIEAPDPQEMIDLESKFEVLETEVKEINTNKETLKRNLLDLIELEHILHKTQTFFDEAEQGAIIPASQAPPLGPMPHPHTNGGITSEEESAPERGLLDGEQAGPGAVQHTKFMFVTGVILRERLPAFERLLWRACRGNVFLREAEIAEPLEDPSSGNMVNKSVFILFFQGDQLRSRVRKICEGFRATLYQCPETAAERNEMTVAVGTRISELNSVLRTTVDHSNTQLLEIAQDVDIWQQKVKKIKAIYHTMNMFNLDVTRQCLIAECWCPVEDLDEIQRALVRGTERSGSTVPSILNRMKTDETPPTYFKTNKFTRGFQAIVDAYGIASYEEVNPAPYTVITFPFLFSVMFGDAGHGILLALFAAAMIYYEKRIIQTNAGGEMFGMIFDGRYIVLLMGLFSIYTGLIYNDMFSISLNIFESRWNVSYFRNVSFKQDLFVPPDELYRNNTQQCECPFEYNCVYTSGDETTHLPTEAQNYQEPYPFGLDPIWQMSENKLVFVNTYKMKMSICLGVIHMLFGVIIGIFNHLHFKRYINIVAEFIPQILFLLAIFGWLVFLIFFKWINFYDNQQTAPNLLLTLINMFLEFAGSPKVNDSVLIGDNEYSVFGPTSGDATVQRLIQIFLVLIAVGCVPWMLIVKPVYLYIQHKKKVKSALHAVPTSEEEADQQQEEVVNNDGADGLVGKGGGEGEGEDGKGGGDKADEFDGGEIVVHQCIHTIEYCLGTISHTASYLRLWALSLAHAELSEVLWFMVMRNGFMVTHMTGTYVIGGIALFALFAFWAVLTVGILLVMEGLSAFLHALRLHWVEFQSKFYIGTGYKFQPFSFEAVLKGEDD